MVEYTHSPTGLGQGSGAPLPARQAVKGAQLGPWLLSALVLGQQVQKEDPGKQVTEKEDMGTLLGNETTPSNPPQYRPSYKTPAQTRTKNEFLKLCVTVRRKYGFWASQSYRETLSQQNRKSSTWFS